MKINNGNIKTFEYLKIEDTMLILRKLESLLIKKKLAKSALKNLNKAKDNMSI